MSQPKILQAHWPVIDLCKLVQGLVHSKIYNPNAGLEIATNTVAFATELLPFATKASAGVANLWLVFTFAITK